MRTEPVVGQIAPDLGPERGTGSATKELGVPQPPALPTEVWINQPPLASPAPILGRAPQRDAQDCPRIDHRDPGRDPSTPGFEGEALVAAVQ